MIKSKEEILLKIENVVECSPHLKELFQMQFLDSIRFPLTIAGETRLCYHTPQGYTNCPREAENIWAHALKVEAIGDGPTTTPTYLHDCRTG